MNKATVWLKDYTHSFYNRAILYFKNKTPRHFLEHTTDGKVPVILLPGLFNQWMFFKPIADTISMLGHPVYVVPKLGSNVIDVPKSAKIVREIIEENDLKNVIILAHSKGGIMGKHILVHEDPDKRIKGVIAIATPFGGSTGARFIPHRSVREFSPESKIILDLQNHPEVNGKIISIIPSYDNVIWHSEKSYLEGALENIQVKASGHTLILKDAEVGKKVVECVEKISRI